MITDEEIQKIFDWADKNKINGKRLNSTAYEWGIDISDEHLKEHWFKKIRKGIPRDKDLLKKITHLNLEYNKLKDIPKEFGKLINLQHINLDNNHIKILPNDFFNLINLQTLSLSSNNLVEMSSSIQNCKNLKKIYLDRNPLKTIPNEIGNLLKLKVLDLSSCDLETLPIEIGKLQELKNLNLEFCKKLIEIPTSIGKLTKLETLSFRYCKKIKFLPSELGMLKNLKNLDLENCTSLISLPSEIGNLNKLDNLDLRGCHELKNIPTSIGMLSSLKKLNIQGCQTLDELPLEMKNLNSLEYLNLAFCDFKKIPEVIGNIKNLTHLDITSNYSLEEIPNNFSNLTKLNILEIDIDEEDDESQKLKKQIINITGMKFFKFSYNTTVFLRTCNNNHLENEIVNIRQLFSNHKIGNLTFPHKNLLLKGVPGTGKSHTLENIIENDLNLKEKQNNICRINIHSASSNADLMQGIGIDSNDGKIEYKEKQGLIFNHIRKALFTPNQPFVLVLEEIQENSLNELIGDLIYLIEEKKRVTVDASKFENGKEYEYQTFIENVLKDEKNKHYIEIPYLVDTATSYRKIVLPSNLYIFCTSNYRDDKKVIEDNLLRRFDVVEVYPKTDREIFNSDDIPYFLERLNALIEEKFQDETHPDRYLIGHANWLDISNEDNNKNKKLFYTALLKVLIEFKEIREVDFEAYVKEILEGVCKDNGLSDRLKGYIEACNFEYSSYKEMVEKLQKEIYSFLK